MSVVAGPGFVSLLGLDPATYDRHAVHGGGGTYGETNCYADVLVELLHARGDEPLAAMGHLVRMDFEGDQFTFFKPPPGDVEALFGVDVHEMQPYRPLPNQIAEQIEAGRTLIVELDAWFLPDTAATSYRAAHVKTSCAFEAIDLEGERLRYFHGPGLFELAGEDYRGVFRLDGTGSADVLPPYTELVRFDAGPRLEGEALRAAARGLLRHHLARRPTEDPILRFGAQLAATLPDLLAGDAQLYHDYAFATVRMLGSGAEVLAAHASWLLGAGARAGAEPAVAALGRVVDGAKLLSFKLARRRAFEPEAAIADLASAWDEALDRLDAATT